MRVPADVYHPSAKRLDERIKPHLYDLGTETKSVSAAGFVALNGRNCYVGESFGGVDVAVERDEKRFFATFSGKQGFLACQR